MAIIQSYSPASTAATIVTMVCCCLLLCGLVQEPRLKMRRFECVKPLNLYGSAVHRSFSRHICGGRKACWVQRDAALRCSMVTRLKCPITSV